LSARCCSDFMVPMACSITVDFLQASRPKISRLLRINSSPQGRILKALKEMLRACGTDRGNLARRRHPVAAATAGAPTVTAAATAYGWALDTLGLFTVDGCGRRRRMRLTAIMDYTQCRHEI
jgi:hypothetical protein